MANFSFNKIILGGRLTADVELKQTPNGVPVCSFSLAVNRKGAKDTTDFIDCVAWRSTAEFISRYFKKGSSICIVGSIQKRNWTDNNGNKRYVTEIVTEEAYFVDSKGETGESTVIPDAPDFVPVGDDDDLPF